DEVTGEVVARLVGDGAVGHEVGQVLGRVTRRVAGGDGDVPEGERVPVLQALRRETVLPVLASRARDVQRGPGRGGELARTGEEIGVEVGLGDGGDGHPVVGGEVQIHLDVAAGVHHQGLPAGLAAHEVARLGQVLVVDA